MSSDRQPITQPTAPPPSYTESQKQFFRTQECNPQPPSTAVPPPYSPNPAGSSIIVESTGPGYQRFDVIDAQPHVVSIFQLGPESCLVVCPACGKQVMTVTHPVPGTITWVTACFCFFFCILCTFLPFCIPELQDVAHECPLCQCEVGIYSRL